jgi:endonuclease III
MAERRMTNKEKTQSVAELLLSNRELDGDSFWRWLFKERSPLLREANKFLLACILDYQIPANRAWDNAERLAEEILSDPEWLWREIVREARETWMSRKEEYNLHRFPQAHERVWTIGKRIVEQYDGDARKIWEGQSIDETLHRLNDIRVGEQISRMVVGALCDTHQIQGKGDVKADIHVRRVLGRVFQGEKFSANNAGDVIDLTREMHPENPWLLDRSLYSLGKERCFASSPECDGCYLENLCTYRNRS